MNADDPSNRDRAVPLLVGTRGPKLNGFLKKSGVFARFLGLGARGLHIGPGWAPRYPWAISSPPPPPGVKRLLNPASPSPPSSHGDGLVSGVVVVLLCCCCVVISDGAHVSALTTLAAARPAWRVSHCLWSDLVYFLFPRLPRMDASQPPS